MTIEIVQQLFAAAISLSSDPIIVHNRGQHNTTTGWCAMCPSWKMMEFVNGRTTTHIWNGKENSCLKPPTRQHFVHTCGPWHPMADHCLKSPGKKFFSTGGVVQLSQLSIPGHHRSRIRKITCYVLSMSLQRLQPQINLVWFLPLDKNYEVMCVEQFPHIFGPTVITKSLNRWK